jgi:hypothetical protein
LERRWLLALVSSDSAKMALSEAEGGSQEKKGNLHDPKDGGWVYNKSDLNVQNANLKPHPLNMGDSRTSLDTNNGWTAVASLSSGLCSGSGSWPSYTVCARMVR